MIPPKHITKVFGEIVAAVSAAVLPELQEHDASIQGVYYQHGHPLEITNTLQQMTESPVKKYQRFPLIMLFEDIGEAVGQTGYASTVSLRVAICNYTVPTIKSADRETRNFDPILWPIYYELMRVIGDNRAFVTADPDRIPHTRTARKYWGSDLTEQGNQGNQRNKFSEYLDAIDIQNLQLVLDEDYCSHPISLT